MSDTPDTNTDSPDNKAGNGSYGCGCLFLLITIPLALYLLIDKSDFYLMPGEANLIVEAMEKTFDNIDQILPDSLVVTDELNPYLHYSEGESFGNIFYGLNPIIDVAAKADTSRKYKFQYVARVDHVDADEFVIKTFQVDSIWRYKAFVLDDEPFFNMDPND